MPKKDFAGGGPKGSKGFPMNDKTHARLAISGATRSMRAGNISASKAASIKSQARSRLRSMGGGKADGGMFSGGGRWQKPGLAGSTRAGSFGQHGNAGATSLPRGGGRMTGSPASTGGMPARMADGGMFAGAGRWQKSGGSGSTRAGSFKFRTPAYDR